MFEWHKKEKPFLGMAGMGGGVVSKLMSSVGNEVFSGTGGVVSAGVAPGNGYRYHYFKDPGTFVVSAAYGNEGGSTIDILVVAGGGSAGARVGGGGGAGGIAWAQAIPIPKTVAGQSIPITVGTGGAVPSPPSPAPRGNTGNDSAFGVSPNPYYILAKGGGYGGGDNVVPGGDGGSGGGSEYGPPDPGTGGSGIQPAQNSGKPWVTNYGNPGSYGGGPPNWQSGAGGGAGSAASNGDQSNRGSAGAGQEFPTFAVPLYMPAPDPYRPSINPLPGTYYGGGGGGGDYPPFIPQNHPTLATYGGGGAGGLSGSSNGYPGVNGLGGGGGGATSPGNDGPLGGSGGNGIVVIRYSI